MSLLNALDTAAQAGREGAFKARMVEAHPNAYEEVDNRTLDKRATSYNVSSRIDEGNFKAQIAAAGLSTAFGMIGINLPNRPPAEQPAIKFITPTVLFFSICYLF